MKSTSLIGFSVSTREKHSAPGPKNAEYLPDKDKHHQSWRPWHCTSVGEPERHGQHTDRNPLLHEPRTPLQ